MLRKLLYRFVDLNIESKNNKSFYFVLFILLMIPVLSIAYYSLVKSYNENTERVIQNKKNIADLASIILKEKLDASVSLGVSLATRPKFIEEIEKGNWSNSTTILSGILDKYDYIDRILITDTKAIIKATIPNIPEVIGTSRDYRDWYNGVKKEWKPYISENYKRTSQPQINVVGIAIPIIKENSTIPLGILLIQIKLLSFYEWAQRFPGGKNEFAYIVDQKGQIVYHPKLELQKTIYNYSEENIVKYLLQGQSGVKIEYDNLENENAIFAFNLIPKYSWGVIISQPTQYAFYERNSKLLSGIIFFLILILFSAILFISLIVIIMEHRKIIKTERNMAKEFLFSEKLNSIRELASGMAHEINNPLAVAIGFKEMIKKYIEDKGLYSEKINDLLIKQEKAHLRIASIVNSLRTYALDDMEKEVILNIDATINETLGLIESTYKEEGILIEKKLDSHANISANKGKIQQLLMILLSNAKDALVDKSKDCCIKIETFCENKKLVIKVSDNGIGIPNDVIKNIFDPFYTTKPVGKGTGLGLATALGIVNTLKGNISVESSINVGTTFKIIL